MKEKSNSPDIGFLRDQTAKKIEELLRERQELDRRILSLKQSLRSFDTYLEAEGQTKSDTYRMDPIPLPFGLEGLRELGITDAVRKIIKTSIEPISARQIRTKLESHGYQKLPENNPLAAIHAVLTRLEKNNEIRSVKGSDKKPAYEWRDEVSDSIDRINLQFGTKAAKAKK